MTITEIRALLDLIKRLTEENPLKIELDTLTKEEMDFFEQVKLELTKKEVLEKFKKNAYYKSEFI
jgi:tRNA isopentenyl-2-thiomethyl-A-37 hydroxylase MiaE